MAKRWAENSGDLTSSFRFSGFTLLIVAIVVAGALIVSPTLSTYVQQQREVAELRAAVETHRQAVNDADGERVKWQDPAYVRAQARGRLFYVMPGETQLSVIDDIVIPPESDETTSGELTRAEQNWARALLASTLQSGTTSASPEELLGETDEADSGETPADPAGATQPDETANEGSP